MTKAFAKECGPLGIRVNALLPGLTKTKFAGALFDNEDVYDYWIKRIPLRRHAASWSTVRQRLCNRPTPLAPKVKI